MVPNTNNQQQSVPRYLLENVVLFLKLPVVTYPNKPLQYSCLENPMNSMKRQKDRTLKDELFTWAGAQYATGDQWRTNSRKNEETESKQKQNLVVDVTGDGSKV